MSGNVVVVTGAGGFVGSAVTRRLVAGMADGSSRFADGSPVEHVVAILRPGGSLDRLQDLRDAPESAWSVARVDLREVERLGDLLHDLRPRAIVHAALDASAFLERSAAEVDHVHGLPLATLARSLKGVAGARLVHTGSAWVLASGRQLAEDARVAVASPYARVKHRLDVLLPEVCGPLGVEWVNLRLFNMYGRYEPTHRLLPTLVRRLARGEIADLSHGDQVRDFSDVDDAAGAYVLALRAPSPACNAVYHVGTGVGMTVRAFAGIVAEVTGGAERVRFGSSPTPDRGLAELVADPGLARRRLGWQPTRDTGDAIRAAARWWLQRPDEDRRGPLHSGS